MSKGKNQIEDKDRTGGFNVNPNNINKEGRPKKIYTILKEKGYNKSDIITAFGEVAFYTMKELDAIIADQEKPIIVQIIAKQMKTAMEKGEWSRIKEIMEYTLGKPVQSLDVNVDQVNIDPKEFIRK